MWLMVSFDIKSQKVDSYKQTFHQSAKFIPDWRNHSAEWCNTSPTENTAWIVRRALTYFDVKCPTKMIMSHLFVQINDMRGKLIELLEKLTSEQHFLKFLQAQELVPSFRFEILYIFVFWTIFVSPEKFLWLISKLLISYCIFQSKETKWRQAGFYHVLWRRK